MQRLIDAITLRVGRPWFVLLIAACFIAWIALHAYAAIVPSAHMNLDGNWISIALQFAAFIMTALILTGQHKEEDLSNEREELTLHLLMTIDRKLSTATSSAPLDLGHAKRSVDDAHRTEFEN